MNASPAPRDPSVMGLLAAGVPLSLLADLVAPPNSVEVLLVEWGRARHRS